MATDKIENFIKRAIDDPDSAVYNSTNVKNIKDYLLSKNVNVDRDTIKTILDKQSISQVRYKNEGKRNISETATPFILRGRFFSTLMADTMILSSKRNYNAPSPYLLIVLCQLSRFIFIESAKSLKFEDQKKCWQQIFNRINKVSPIAKTDVVQTDMGIEFGNNLRSWFKSMGIKLKRAQIRPYRLSRGIPGVESAIRRVRNNLERELLRGQRKRLFSEILKTVESTCNNQLLSSIGMTADEALRHSPSYIAMVSESKKMKKRKYLRSAILVKQKIPLYTVVKIKKYQDKMFKSSTKESYQHLSPCFVVMKVLTDRELPRFKLGNLFTLTMLPGSYTVAELYVSKLSYIEACSFEEKNISKVVKIDGNVVHYTIEASDRIFTANKSLLENA